MSKPIACFSRAAFLLCSGLWLASAGSASAAEYDAELDFARRVELGTPVKGVVRAVPVQVGARVEAGGVLVQLDDRGFRARLVEAEARLASLAAFNKEAQRELERAEELYDRTVLADHELQLARNNAIKARADYETARAARVQRQLDLEYSAIKAPFAARVIALHAEVGQSVAGELQPMPLATVIDADHMLARAGVPAAEAQALEPGSAASVTVDGRRHEGRIHSVALVPGPGGHVVEIIFPVEQQRYRVGQRARVRLP